MSRAMHRDVQALYSTGGCEGAINQSMCKLMEYTDEESWKFYFGNITSLVAMHALHGLAHDEIQQLIDFK